MQHTYSVPCQFTETTCCWGTCKKASLMSSAARHRKMRKIMSLNSSICLMLIFGAGKVYTQRRSSPVQHVCHPSCLLWFHGFCQTFQAAGCVQSVKEGQSSQSWTCSIFSMPRILIQALTGQNRLSLKRLFLETRSSLHYASKAKLVLFKQQAFNATGEDHFLDSKKPMCLRPRKWDCCSDLFFAKNGGSLPKTMLL